jgi:hypothetical protein
MTDLSPRPTAKEAIRRGARRLWKWVKAVDTSLDVLTVLVIVVMVIGAVAIVFFRCATAALP